MPSQSATHNENLFLLPAHQVAAAAVAGFDDVGRVTAAGVVRITGSMFSRLGDTRHFVPGLAELAISTTLTVLTFTPVTWTMRLEPLEPLAMNHPVRPGVTLVSTRRAISAAVAAARVRRPSMDILCSISTFILFSVLLQEARRPPPRSGRSLVQAQHLGSPRFQCNK